MRRKRHKARCHWKKIPKSLIKIHNTEILWYIIMMLKKIFNHFILPVGYKEN